MYMATLIPQWIPVGSAAAGLVTLSLAVALGLGLGAIRVRGIRLGVAGVLFSSLLFGQLGLSIDPRVLEFLRDFALIIFVYAIGLQVGPGFVSSLRSEGLRLNILSLLVIFLGALLTALIFHFVKLPRAASSGLYAGAFTTTPGLAAGQESLRHTLAGSSEKTINSAVDMASLAYTVAYPLGILGPILVIAILRKMFGVRMQQERDDLAATEQSKRPPITSLDVEITQEHHAGKVLREQTLSKSLGITFSRMLRDGVVSVPTGDTVVRVGDVYRAVGSRAHLEELVRAMGKPSTADMGDVDGDIRRVALVVTRTQVLRRPLRELDLIRRAGITLSRVNRAGIELVPKASLRLQFGDRVTAIGSQAGLQILEAELGNSPETLNRPQLIPIFLGTVLGVLIGSIPLAIPGLNLKLRIGLAGGPMIAAIMLSQLGNLGSVIWYMPTAANQLFRDFGLAVFLACVGMQSGNNFLGRLTHGGLQFIVWGFLITILPVLLVGIFARRVLKLNFITLSGWVAGAMTSSPALLFADDLAGSDAPALAYAAVAPLGMLAPILCSQLLVVLLS